MLTWISEFWCKKMHSGAMWPIHGKYICPDCLREYPVAWEGDVKAVAYADAAQQQQQALRVNSVSISH